MPAVYNSVSRKNTILYKGANADLSVFEGKSKRDSLLPIGNAKIDKK